MRLRPAGAALVLVALVVAAGCGSPKPASTAPASTPGPTPAVSPGLPSAVAATPTIAPATSSPAAGMPEEDPSLLAVLPADIDGRPVTLESEAFVDAVADVGFAANVEAAAFGIVLDRGGIAVVAVVARPVPGTYSEAWFRDWRDSYNEGACAQSGGVARNAEAELGGRTVFIGTCAGGLITYHVWLAQRGLIVSAFAVGENRLGERLMAGLRP